MKENTADANHERARRLKERSMERVLDKLYNDLRFIQDRRSKLSIVKIGFVAGFFGIGSLKFNSDLGWAALYLVPLVAVLFDLFGIASTTSIRKLEALLRIVEKEQEVCVEDRKKSQDEPAILERWCSFSQKYRLSRLSNFTSHVILTLTAFIVPIGILKMTECPQTDWWTCIWKIKLFCWFVVVGGLWGYFRYCEWKAGKILAQASE